MEIDPVKMPHKSIHNYNVKHHACSIIHRIIRHSPVNSPE